MMKLLTLLTLFHASAMSWRIDHRCTDMFAVASGIKLSEGQRAAIRMAATAPVMVLTGGPGCGKTFATATIVKLWRAMRMRSDRRSPQSFEVSLCAPTGMPTHSRTFRVLQGFAARMMVSCRQAEYHPFRWCMTFAHMQDGLHSDWRQSQA